MIVRIVAIREPAKPLNDAQIVRGFFVFMGIGNVVLMHAYGIGYSLLVQPCLSDCHVLGLRCQQIL